MARKGIFGRLVRLSFLLLVAAACGLGYLWMRTQQFADQPIEFAGGEKVLEVAPGDGFNDVMRKMRGIGISQGSDLEWRALARSMKVAARLQVGEYSIESGMSPRTILQRMHDGRVIQRKFTIVEGWNFRELRAALLADTELKHEIGTLGDVELMQKLDRAGMHPEGRFLPETYLFTRSTSDLQILRRAADAMDKALAEAWAGRAQGQPLQSPEELLTLASIVEKETGIAQERPQIAGVFSRRLQSGMRLQTDPTVIYGIGSAYDGNIRRKDLETDTPYNTYTRDGLPPTPIAMPGVQALEAAAKPAAGDALYFVAVGDGSGRHVFTRSYSDHQAAVSQYLKRYRNQRTQAQ